MLLHNILKSTLLLLLIIPNSVLAETITPTNDGYVRVAGIDGTYASKRDSTEGNSAIATSIAVGQAPLGTFYIWRSFATFAIPAMGKPISGTLYLYGNTDNSTADFGIYVLVASDYSSGGLEKTDYIKFDGRTVGGAHTGSILNNTWNSASYSAGWNAFEINAAGLDTLAEYSGKSLYIALISKEDYDNSEPVAQEYIAFESTNHATYKPYLDLRYTTGASRSFLNPTYLIQNGTIPPLVKP